MRSPRLSRRLLALSLWLIIAVLLVPAYLRMGLVDPLDYTRGGLGGADFKSYYVAGRLLLENADIYDERNQARLIHGLGLVNDYSFYIYPPLLAIGFIPLALLPIETAARIWFLLNFLVLAACFVILIRMLRLHLKFGELLPLAVIAGGLFAPVIYSMRMGQINIILLLLLVAACALIESGRDGAAGLALAFASVLKVMPIALLGYLVWRKRFRAGLVGALGILGLVLFDFVFLALWQHDVSLDWRYLTQVLPTLTAPDANLMNQSLNAFLTRNVQGQAAPLLPILYGFISVASVVIAMIWISRLPRTRKEGLGMTFVLLTMLIITGKTMMPTFALLLFPYAVMAVEVSASRWRTPGIAGLILSCALIEASFFMPHVPAEIADWIAGLSFLGAVAAWALAAALVVQSTRRAGNESNV